MSDGKKRAVLVSMEVPHKNWRDEGWQAAKASAFEIIFDYFLVKSEPDHKFIAKNLSSKSGREVALI